MTSESDGDFCWFCGELAVGEALQTAAHQCITERDDLDAEETNYNERLIKTGVWNAIIQPRLMHSEILPWYARMFYTLKLLVCCLFGWGGGGPFWLARRI